MRARSFSFGIGVCLALVGCAAEKEDTGNVQLGVHDLGSFELDRNAVDDAAAGDDWGTLFAGGGSANAFSGILPDIGADGGTQFQGGGSKDNNDISEWLWKPGEPLDKDDITNAYAAAYVNTVDTGNNNAGDLIVYYGLDRFANNGSAQVGFWFFQEAIGTTNTPSSGGFLFSGVHSVGDLLVQSNFSQGGVIDSISVFKWVGSGGSNGALDLLFNAQDCNAPTAPDDPACATVNRANTSSPWPYTPKSGSPNIFPQGSFFEGGLNISRLVPGAGCFSSFLAETRTSTPFDARLKDFVIGNFELCEISVAKTGDTISKVGDAADYTITISNSGSLTLYKDNITDTLLGDITLNGIDQVNAFVQSNTCGASLAAGASCTITLKRTVQAGDSDPLPNTVTVEYKGKADLSDTGVSASDGHSVNLFEPSLTIDKTGGTLSKVGDSVTYTIKVCNTSSSDSPNLVKDSVSDTLIAGVDAAFAASLAPGACESHNFTRTVQAGDADPLVNTATAHYHPSGFPNDISASDGHSVNLFQPSITIDKTGDTLSKVGDDVSYTIKVCNTSSSDTPALVKDSVSDSLIPGVNAAFAATLASGACESHSFTRTVQAGDSDPLVNTATAHYHPTGFPNDISASDNHSVNLFQPSLTIAKTGDTLSKVGDDVTYTIKVCNTSSLDSPALIKDSVTDSLIPDVNAAFGVSLAAGACEEHSFTRAVQAGDADPLENTATAHYHPAGFPNDISASDGHSVNLFQPSITVTKTGDEVSKVGDDVTYTIKVCNTSSDDTPTLVKDGVTDSLIDGVDAAFGATLAAGECEEHSFTRTVVDGDPDPLVNTVTAHYHPGGFPNDITASGEFAVDLVHPGLAVHKDCSPTTAAPGDTITYTCTISNTGDVALERLSIVDSLKGDLTDPANFTSSTCGSVLGAGESCTIVYTFIAPSGTATLINTVTATYKVQGLPNVLIASASCTVQIPSEGCTPGFWKNHPELWDEPTDPIAAAAGFTTSTSFNAFFNLTSAQSGFPDSLTMLDATNLGGGGAQKLARHGVPALLNLAAGLNYPLPAGINDAGDLYDAIRNAYLTGTFEPLASQLAAANELNCPF